MSSIFVTKQDNKWVEPQKDSYSYEEIQDINKQDFVELYIMSCKMVGVSTEELAKQCGIPYESFRKLVYMNGRVSNKRDFIFMLCALLGINDEEEINNALKCYNGFSPLDDNNPRDYIIKRILKQQTPEKPRTITEINANLMMYDMPPLNYGQKKKALSAYNSKYKVLWSKSETNVDEAALPYLALSDYYHPKTRYVSEAYSKIIDTQKDFQYGLKIDQFGKLFCYPLPYDILTYKQYESIDNTGDLRPLFEDLLSLIQSDMKNVLNCLNDTKNYHERYSANVFQDHLHVFIERHNGFIPEREEYYFFELVDEKYRLTLSTVSLFMQSYLSEEEYRHYFGNPKRGKTISFDSEDEIITYFDSNKQNQFLTKNDKQLILSVYQIMKKKCIELINKIKNNQLEILNTIFLDGTRYSELAYFNAIDLFHYSFMDGETDQINCDNSIDLKLEDNSTISITPEDLTEAYRLGFNNIMEVGRVKKKHGTLQAIFPSNLD